MGDDWDDEEKPPPRPPLWMPRQPRLPVSMCLQETTTKKFDRQPYTDTCVRENHAIRLHTDDAEEEGREEGGGSKKKSSARGPLMVGDTLFKRWNVPVTMKTAPEKEDERDVWMLKQMHYQMNYADTYLELSGSKVFAVDYYDRGISLTCILTYCICCGILIQKVEEYRNKYLVNLGDAYCWVFNFLWWNALQVTNYMLIAHCFGILQFLIIPVIRRIYYIMFSMAFTAMLCCYLQKQGCWAMCPFLMWAAFIITTMTAGRPPISNRMGDPLADVLLFVVFLLLALQAICAKDEEMEKCVLMLLLGFAYAAPIGYWGWFNWRIVIYTVSLYNAMPIIETTLSNKLGGHTPKTFAKFIKEDWRKALPYFLALPVSWGCPLKDCERGLFDLFAGGPLGRWYADDDDDKEPRSFFSFGSLGDWGIELPPKFDDGLFWFFIIAMVLFDLYSLHVMETVKEAEVAPPGPCTPYDLTLSKNNEFLSGVVRISYGRTSSPSRYCNFGSLGDWGIELPPKFDDGLFWFFIIAMVLFDLYSLHVMETVKEAEVAPPGPCTPYDLTLSKNNEFLC
ncbi:unnamed protein product [Notodromas monacha]|uniref:Uncharacterized protein n=1 Tax=Notodromas monacha TaxID=399045 RepID=A0A7R9GE56_9CRUS|nr:unnamed protein product [Notodromas monacha]CAG0917915.1 unnamed protein product [Notodromas monacha]